MNTRHSKEIIEVRLTSIREKSFSISADNVENGDLLTFGFNSKADVSSESDELKLNFGVDYFYEDKSVMSCSCDFVFHVVNLQKYTTPDGAMINELLYNVISVAIGTLRGVMTIRTNGTKLANFPLPMIDPIKFVSDSYKQMEK